MNKIPSNYVYVLYLNDELQYICGVFDTIEECSHFLHLTFHSLCKSVKRGSTIQGYYKLEKVQIYDYQFLIVDKDNLDIVYYQSSNLKGLSDMTGFPVGTLRSAFMKESILYDKYLVVIKDMWEVALEEFIREYSAPEK